MPKFFIGILLLFGVTELFAGQYAPLGKLLAKRIAQLSPEERSTVLISFTDKGSARNITPLDRHALVSERSLQRRLRVRPTQPIDEADLPLEQSYVDQIVLNVVTLRHQLKWFNAVSAIATKRQIEQIRSLPFVAKIELVGRWKKKDGEEIERNEIVKASPAPTGTTSLDYGSSFTQLNQINVPAVHNLGIYGQGVIVGVLDNGFRLLTHEAFASMNIIAQYDFVDHKTSVIPNNPAGGFGAHGVNTLSAIGGYKPGQLIGPAFKSSFILARTENDSSETPVEEDNWAKAIEWADSIGVQVTSTSLGYYTYDAPYTSWTFQDMDGATTLITQAADHAAALGIVVVNSAGNEALNRSTDPNSLIAPADGFDVITVGAVNSSGVRAAFSSFGPTFDGRTKPDVMAMGVNVRLASSSLTTGYVNGAGTSFSCPLTAGVAALLLCANPLLDPSDIANAFRETASNFSSPDNFYGWGIVNALDAVHYNTILPLGKVHGIAYIDSDGDGVIEGGEPAAVGVKILLGGTMAESTYTDALGHFDFDSLAIGNYTLHQVVPAGRIQTYPDSGYAFSLLHGADTSGYRFAGFDLGSIHGIVFDDLNQDGIRDSGEAGLSGWTVRLFGSDTLAATSDVNGGFGFSGLPAGSYSLSESSNAGWMQTVPPFNGAYAITVTSGTDTSGLLFGNAWLPAFNFHVLDNWNLLAPPYSVADPRTTVLYPTAVTSAFKYAGTYKHIDSVTIGTGFWLKFAYAQNVFVMGDPITEDTVSVKKGWNIIGGLSAPYPVSSIVQNPPGIVLSGYYYYNGAYQTTDSIRPHAGNWVKVSADGNLIFTPASMEAGASPSQARVDDHSRSAFTFEDAKGLVQTLFLAERVEIARSELPPLPPEGGFDVRFASQGSVASVAPGEAVAVNITGGTYPLTIRNDAAGSGARIVLNGNIVPQSGPAITILQPPVSLQLQAGHTGANPAVPLETALDQNYPNPFNPETNFAFRISEGGLVKLSIFDVLGREIASIVNEPMEPGSYSLRWDASKSPSGVYYFRLTAGAFSDVKKMILLR